MIIDELLKDKTKKPKEKTEIISNWIKSETLPMDELIAFAEKSKDPIKATCIESMEYVTKENKSLADESMLNFVVKQLQSKAPRVKWESARVIGNIASLFPNQLDTAIEYLVENTSHDGTVVRWSSAYALGEILKLKQKNYKQLLILIDGIIEKEEKNSIKKVYLDAVKKSKK